LPRRVDRPIVQTNTIARVNDVRLLREVIEMGVESAAGEGGPFGAVVALDGGRVVGRGTNRVVSEGDPTLCFGAAWWARVDRIVHAASRADAASAGFDDAAVHADVARPPDQRRLATVQLLAEEGWRPFAAWAANPARVQY
jgi:guanine deaminase